MLTRCMCADAVHGVKIVKNTYIMVAQAHLRTSVKNGV